MPSNVTKVLSSALLTLTALAFTALAQTTAQISEQTPQTPVPTSGDVMRDRISKAKAFVAVRNYNAAIYELENIRKESADPAVRAVVNVLLMNSYLEQGDYKRAQDFLNQFYNEQKTTKAGAGDAYAAVAGQVVKSARSRAERYKALGLNIADRTLPLEALNDLEKMRETVEIVITQAKEIGKTPAKTQDAMALLEEATNSRSAIARDDYDAKRWKDEVADTREEITNSRSVVLNAVNGTAEPNATQQVSTQQVATNTPPASTPANTPPAFKPVTDNKPAPVREREVKPADTNTASAKNDKPIVVPSAPPSTQQKEEAKPADNTAKTDVPATEGPLDVGETLVNYATNKHTPIYPPMARSMRTTGIVKVDVTIDEDGHVAEVQNTSGPSILQNAAKDAIKKWRFKPFTRDGQPVRATGSVNFNFAL